LVAGVIITFHGVLDGVVVKKFFLGARCRTCHYRCEKENQNKVHTAFPVDDPTEKYTDNWRRGKDNESINKIEELRRKLSEK